jgi:hypothetical protein
METLPENAELYIDGSRGQYIPQNFFEITLPDCINWHGIADEKDEILKDCSSPENEFYWDSWIRFEDYATVTNPDTTIEYNLYQDGDLWLIPVDAEWPDND